MSLLEELSSHTANQAKRPKGAGRQMFIAQQAEISSAIDGGYPILEVWLYLRGKGRMPITYGVFCDYVYRFIKKNQRQKTEDTTKERGGGAGKTVQNSVNNTTNDNMLGRAGWTPRGVGNIPPPDYFGREVDMTDAFKPVE